MSAPRRPARARPRLVGLAVVVLGLFGVGLFSVSIAVIAQQLPQTSGSASGSGVVMPSGAEGSPGVMVTAEPGSSSGMSTTVTGVSVVVPDGGELEEYQSRLLRLLITTAAVVLIGMVAAAGLLVWWQANRILQPLANMVELSRRVDERTISERVSVENLDDEFSELGEALNDMLDRIETGYRSEAMLASAASHELYTPIAAQRTVLEVALSDPDAEAQDLRRACESVLNQNRRLERILGAVLTFGRLRHGGRGEDVAAVAIDEVIGKIIAETPAEGVTVTARLDPVVLTTAMSSVILLFRNLFTNAVSHNVADGWIRVALRHGWDCDGTAAHLLIENSCVLQDETGLGELRKPFRRGAADRSQRSASVGLGLTVIEAIARQYGWSLTISVPAPGTFAVSVVMHGSVG